MIPSSASLVSPSEAYTAAELDERCYTNVWDTTNLFAPALAAFLSRRQLAHQDRARRSIMQGLSDA